jgi:hypothetical protein
VKSMSVPIAGIVAAALLDHRWSWGTLAGVLVAMYCHRLYRRAPIPALSASCLSPEDELRPGWAARWGVSGRADARHVRAKWPEAG